MKLEMIKNQVGLEYCFNQPAINKKVITNLPAQHTHRLVLFHIILVIKSEHKQRKKKKKKGEKPCLMSWRVHKKTVVSD